MPGKRQVTLRPPGNYPLLRGPLGRLILKPWFDRVAFYLVTRGLMPLSRTWAEAVEIVSSETAYEDAMAGRLKFDGGHRKALTAVKRRKDGYDATAAAWEEMLFGGEDPGIDSCTQLEIERQKAAHKFMVTRLRFIHRWGRLPGMRWDLSDERAVMHKHGHRLKGREAAFPVPQDVAVEKSHPVRGAYGPEYWLRFPSPSANIGDTAWVHVYEPEGVSDPPTLIFLHGICMEPEMWQAMVDPVTDIVRQGVRVVRPEAPWHGRRMKPGFYGGEPAISQGPMGMIDLFEGWVAEVAVLMGWARDTSKGRVAIGGLSLGSLATQLAATAAVYWPDRLKPDAKILMVTSGDIMATAYHGALPTILGLPERLNEIGWNDKNLKDWLTLLQPMERSAVPPDRTIMLLGETDVVTPYAGGRKLAEDWHVPPENLFIRPGGHFSTPLSQYYDSRPMDRLYEMLR